MLPRPWPWLQILNVLAPVQAGKGDLPGAQQMFTSAITLARAQGDLPSLVAALQGTVSMYDSHPSLTDQKPAEATTAQKQRDYLARKQAELAGRQQAAQRHPGHAGLVGWEPPT